MAWLLKVYMKACEAAGETPDIELLAPILTRLMEVKKRAAAT